MLSLVDEPAAEPGPGQMRLTIEAIGVNRLDQMMRAGSSPRPISFSGARLAIEATGTIDSTGAGVQALGPGDPVIITAVPDMDTNGTYAESIVLPADRVIPRPSELDPVAAAALWVAHSTAYGALIDTAGMRPGDSVLITAASSSVGLAAIQTANQIGAIPIAVTRSGSKRERLLAAGAAAVIAADSDDIAATAQALTDGAGVDIIIDSVMGPGLAELASAARPGGTLVAVGWLDPRPASFPTNAPFTIHATWASRTSSTRWWFVASPRSSPPAFAPASPRRSSTAPSALTTWSMPTATLRTANRSARSSSRFDPRGRGGAPVGRSLAGAAPGAGPVSPEDANTLPCRSRA